MANDTKVVYDKEMKSIKFGPDSDTYEVVDDKARTDLAEVTGQVETLMEEVGEVPTTYATKTELETGLNNKQDALISGTNIKTINNQSLLGEGNIEVGGSYILPVASADELGGVKVGEGLSIDNNGVLSADGTDPYVLPTASADELGGVKVGEGLSIDENGVLSAEGSEPYVLPTASSEVLGGVKVGEGLSIDGSGVLSANGGGSSSMLVIEPTPVVYENLTWNQVLEKAFDVNSFYGLLFNSPIPSDLLIDSTSSFTLSNADISIMVSADTVTVTVGTISHNIYENGSWDSKSDIVIKDEGIDVGVRYINDEKGGTVSLDFVYKDTGDSATAILDTTGASSIKNISPDYVLFKTSAWGDTSSIKYFISNANITCTDVIFDSTFENNLVNDTYVMIGASYDSSLTLESGSGTCYVNDKYGSFYSSDWQPTSTDLGNGCSWDVSTYTLTFPTPLKLWVESYSLSAVSNNITFKVKISGGEIIIPSASNYSNQLAEIKDTINHVDLIIYSTGTEWKFASDVLQLNQKQFNSIPTESNSLYGISLENRWCIDPYNGLPAKIPTGNNSWETQSYQRSLNYITVSDTASPTYVESFYSVAYSVNSSNSTVTFNIYPRIYLSNIFIDVSDTVPTVTFADAWSTGATFIFKQDGTVVNSLTFAQSTYYKIELNSTDFNGQNVIFVDCQSYTKSV